MIERLKSDIKLLQEKLASVKPIIKEVPVIDSSKDLQIS
jgi:hypothetical protein